MKTRDATRSRAAILDAAERLFAEKGFDGCSLSDIGSAASLSRAAPSYFFGSKEKLYRTVLTRVFADRERATRNSVKPVLDWCEDDILDHDHLESSIAEGMEGYMRFLISRPAFGRLIYWEELSGGKRLQRTRRDSTALTDAFTAVRAEARRRGLSSFDVTDAVVLWVSLTFLPATLPATFLASQDRDLSEPQALQHYASLSAAQMRHYLVTGPTGDCDQRTPRCAG